MMWTINLSAIPNYLENFSTLSMPKGERWLKILRQTSEQNLTLVGEDWE